jgi:serine/threonine-protein kinase HipA
LRRCGPEQAGGRFAGLVTAVFDELRTRAPAAIEQVRASLPKAFPSGVADSISNGVKARLRRLEEA